MDEKQSYIAIIKWWAHRTNSPLVDNYSELNSPLKSDEDAGFNWPLSNDEQTEWIHH